MNTRALATQLIYEVLTKGHSLSQMLPRFKNQCQHPQDGAFVQALAFGVIRWYPRLTFIANQLLQKPIKPKDIELLYLICIGIYQLMELKIAEHAAIAETVEAVKILHKGWAASFINAILRSYQRQSSHLQKIPLTAEEAYYAHPTWLIQIIKSAWQKEWPMILENNNLAPPFTLRINLQKSTPEHFIEELIQAGLSATLVPHTKTGVIINTPTDVTALPGFKEGWFSVQDVAAQYAAPLLEITPHARILDACAAPGGKTAHILETEPTVEMIALDISETRTKRIAENLARLQLKATLLVADASDPTEWWDGKLFDRILLDAPCSATGVIRRHPDIKYLRKLSDITKLASQQIDLLNSLWPLLKPGGILVYATCSILPEENTGVMQTFLNQHPDAIDMPIPLSAGQAQTVGYQFLPGQNEADGFYYARVRKVIH